MGEDETLKLQITISNRNLCTRLLEDSSPIWWMYYGRNMFDLHLGVQPPVVMVLVMWPGSTPPTTSSRAARWPRWTRTRWGLAKRSTEAWANITREGVLSRIKEAAWGEARKGKWKRGFLSSRFNGSKTRLQNIVEPMNYERVEFIAMMEHLIEKILIFLFFG